ncbi:hypothetical protein G7Y89_g12664 [Cudoniella acicularis]|uniref:Uncharacterized protein n=1 Tax=Cudoniella acicularis TaxID=354080 RepID=A0A8H4VYY4_9HELO|nr:hypothetical protein G7Y89_g12664 [Cudoniella acicularis]
MLYIQVRDFLLMHKVDVSYNAMMADLRWDELLRVAERIMEEGEEVAQQQSLAERLEGLFTNLSMEEVGCHPECGIYGRLFGEDGKLQREGGEMRPPEIPLRLLCGHVFGQEYLLKETPGESESLLHVYQLCGFDFGVNFREELAEQAPGHGQASDLALETRSEVGPSFTSEFVPTFGEDDGYEAPW